MKELHAALKKFQEQCPSLSKSRTAGLGKFSYQYTPLEEMLSVVQPVLLKNDLVLTQTFGCNEHGQTLIVTHLIHKSGEELKGETPLFLPNDMGSKPMFTYGGSITYARRYAIKMILGIEPDMDMNTEEELPNQLVKPVTKAKTEPVKSDLKTVFLKKLKDPDSDSEKIIAMAEQRHKEGQLSKDDLTEIKLAV
tara:strand:+ start:646 stop:1227 length:582 start_codon:yes stop_codon:yes gene_type:complete